jgi:hypothetical protein
MWLTGSVLAIAMVILVAIRRFRRLGSRPANTPNLGQLGAVSDTWLAHHRGSGDNQSP